MIMRKEPFSVGDYIHVYNRGAKKLPIVRDEHDRWRFLNTLYYFNSIFTPQFWERDVSAVNGQFEWPKKWGSRSPLVKIVAFCLMPNHYHFLLKEIKHGGTALYMKKIGNSYAGYFNEKYHESGSLFQGSYKARRVKTDSQLRYLSVYIKVKNPFELIAGGFEKALEDFNRSFESAIAYDFCSLPDISGRRTSKITDIEILGELYTPQEFRKFAMECMSSNSLSETIHDIAIDE